MKKVKFKDLKQGEVFQVTFRDFNCDTRRVKGYYPTSVNNRWLDGSKVPISDIPDTMDVYIDEPDIPDLKPLEPGVYALCKRGCNLWLFGAYAGIDEGRYVFQKAKEAGSFSVNPEKWNIRLFVLNQPISQENNA